MVAGTAGAAATGDDAGARKVVTIVFADLVGSTALHERLDAESVRRFVDRYYEAMRAAVDAHGGTVTQLLGDGVMAVFGAPRVAEDDALRAVRAAVAMQHAFRALADEQLGVIGKTGLRVAVNTGEVVAGDTTEIIGDPVNVAARLQEQARDGDVVIGEATRRLVSELVTLAPLGTFSLKGRSETVAAYRVVSLDRPAGVAATAFVGRDDELGRITAVYDAAVATRRARLAVILGSPGLGKSRLIAELARRFGDGATVLIAHCDATGGATFAPLAEALRVLLGLDAAASSDVQRAAIGAVMAGDAAERARITGGIAALLAGTPAPPEETFFVVRRLLAALAAAHPVVLAIDDLQWAEPLLLDFTEHLVQWTTDVPLLVLVAARPELRDARSSLATPGGLVSDVVTLGGLDAGAATRLAANVIGAGELPAAVAGRVLATSEGNPLFVGELVRMLVHDGALKREGDRWIAGVDLAALEMPPTIQALLAARIERLRPEERTVLERAAVVGRQFSRAAVAHLLPGDGRDLDTRLEALRRAELVEPDAGWFLGEPALRFHHVLIRDAAYRRVLKGTRAELHGRFADWIENRVGDAIEYDETIGWHLEQAHQHLRELGPIDAHGRALGERAARSLAAAGRRALGRDDVPVAASLFGRALDRLDAADPTRADLALDWCEALLTAGDVGPAAGAIDALGRLIGDSARLRAWHTCFAGQLAALTEPQTLRATADAVAAAAGELAAADDAAGEAMAYQVHALALARLGQVGACEAALDRALAAARRGHDRRRANAVLASAPLAALWGPSPVTRASGRCLDVVRVLRITQGAPAVEAVALLCQGVLEALRGRTEAAHRMVASSRRMVEELGITHRLLEADVFAGHIALLEGAAVAAENSLRPAYDGLREHGLGIDAARAGALLGRALLAQDRAAEAETLSHESERLAGDDLQAAIAWRGVRAEALARRGEHAAAIDFARAAVDLAAATDSLLYHADARLALAAALRAAGHGNEAAFEDARAIELWEAKGATLLVERTRRDVGPGEPMPRAPDDRIVRTQSTRRRVRPNAATANTARFGAAVAARDADALPTLLADDVEVLDHPTGRTYGREGSLATWRSLSSAPDVTYRQEFLATLGDSLALHRSSMSASGATGRKFDIGAFEIDQIVLIEVDAQGRRRRTEVFAPDRLGAAVARLYERYAELLPDGFARDRAAATARVVAAMMIRAVPFESGMVAPNFRAVDHRIVGYGALQGAREASRAVEAGSALAADFNFRVDDVLALSPDALVRKVTQSGVWRDGGGAFERSVCHLSIFDAAGAMIRGETFEADREAEALARIDELRAEPRIASPIRRRVRPNGGTAHADRLNAAIAARDVEAVHSSMSDEMHAVLHPTGAVLDRQESLDWWRLFFEEDRDGDFRTEPVATLGDSLALCRQSWTGTASAGPLSDVGAFQSDVICVIEGDADGRIERSEVFAPDRLGNAVARLYERYAELLPDGLARVRAAATARSVAVLLREPGDRWPVAPDAEATDHRLVGFGSLHGGDAVLRAIRALLELSDDWAISLDDVLCLRTDALLVRRTNSGTDRASGGAFERNLCQLWVIGADGLVTRWEQFDVEQEAEALARFDELTAEPPAVASRAAARRERRVRPNAATAHAARFATAFAARDIDAIAAQSADGEVTDHTSHTTFDRRRLPALWQGLLRARDGTYRHEPLATLGDSLLLFRQWVSASGAAGEKFDVGAYELECISLVEVDGQGRRGRTEVFAADRLGDAIVRLYERYAELLPEGRARARAAATARSLAAVQTFDLDHYRAALAPTVEFVDHRALGFPSTSGAEASLRRLGSLHELAAAVTDRIDDVLGQRSDALLVRWTNSGTDRASGGAFERPFLILFVFGADGLVTHNELFDPNHDDEALARFDELVAEPAAPRIENAATRWGDRFVAAWAARDWEGVAVLPAGFRVIDRRSYAHLDLDRDQHLASLRFRFDMRSSRYSIEGLATRGDRLALFRSRFELADGDVGPSETESLGVREIDEQGGVLVMFDPDDLDAAYAELDARYAAGEAAPYARTVEALRDFRTALAARDWAELTRRIAPDLVWKDHRHLALHEVGSRDEYLVSLRAWLDLAPDVRAREDHVLAEDDRRVLAIARWVGSWEGGGPFEIQFVAVLSLDAAWRLREIHTYDLDQLEEARASFERIGARPTSRDRAAVRIRPNAATANGARADAAFAARDRDALAHLVADDAEVIDHPNGITYNAPELLGTPLLMLQARDLKYRSAPLATLGDSLALLRVSMLASGVASGKLDIGAYEHEILLLNECNADGRSRRSEIFAVDRLGDAVTRLYERYADLLPEGSVRARATATARSVATLFRPINAGPWTTKLAPAMAPDITVSDRRTLGTFSADGAKELLENIGTWYAVADYLSHSLEDVLVLQPNALLVRATSRFTAAEPVGGGDFEIQCLQLYVFGGEGLLSRLELFDADHDAEALARFDELTAAPARHTRIENAATRVMERILAAWEARDWERFAAALAPGFRRIDRRTVVSVTVDLDRGRFVEWMRTSFEIGLSGLTFEALATRGERLLLTRGRFATAGGSGGPSEIDYLAVQEVDEAGACLTIVVFDPDALDAAYADLDERYAAGEAAPHAAVWRESLLFWRALAARDWERLAATFAPGFVLEDHRPLGLLAALSGDAYVASVRALLDLRPDATLRLAHVLAIEDRRTLVVGRWAGSETEGAFEIPVVNVMDFGPEGTRRWHFYNLDQLDEAWARFAALAKP